MVNPIVEDGTVAKRGLRAKGIVANEEPTVHTTYGLMMDSLTIMPHRSLEPQLNQRETQWFWMQCWIVHTYARLTRVNLGCK
jgi:hypothetical protein